MFCSVEQIYFKIKLACPTPLGEQKGSYRLLEFGIFLVGTCNEAFHWLPGLRCGYQHSVSDLEHSTWHHEIPAMNMLFLLLV